MRVLYIAIFLLSAASAALLAQNDPDALYRERATPGRAEAAAAIWEKRLAADPRDVESAWRLARASYWIGTHGPQPARRAALERGVAAAEQTVKLAPMRPEGHFWAAANMGALAESFGLRQGLRYRGAIRESLEAVLVIDPGFQQGSADRALGRWYHKVPRLFGGDRAKAETHLRQSLTYYPDSTVSNFFLAELLFDLDRGREAEEALRRVLAAPADPEWAPEDAIYKARARQLLEARGR